MLFNSNGFGVFFFKGFFVCLNYSFYNIWYIDIFNYIVIKIECVLFMFKYEVKK